MSQFNIQLIRLDNSLEQSPYQKLFSISSNQSPNQQQSWPLNFTFMENELGQETCKSLFQELNSICQDENKSKDLQLNLSLTYDQLLINFQLCSSIFKYLKQIQKDEFNISELGNLFKQFRKLKKIVFRCPKEFNFSEESVIDFMSSMETFKRSLECFEFLHGVSINQGYQSQREPIFRIQLSKFISECPNLNVCKLDFRNIFSKETQELKINMPSDFLNSLLTFSESWPKTFETFELNLDRVIMDKQQFDAFQIGQFLGSLGKLLLRQNNLQFFSLDLSGFQSFNLNTIKRFLPITESIQNVTCLNLQLGGFVKMNLIDWNSFLQSIGSMKKLEELTLNIGFWKTFKSQINICDDYEVDRILNSTPEINEDERQDSIHIEENQQQQIIYALENLLGIELNVDDISRQELREEYEKQQTEVVNKFIDTLLQNNEESLRKFSFNTDNWSFLKRINHSDLINKISKFKKLSYLRLIFSHSEKGKGNTDIKKFQTQLNKKENKKDIKKERKKKIKKDCENDLENEI